MSKGNSDKTTEENWCWPKGAAQDLELLWDIPAVDDEEPELKGEVFNPGFLTDVPWGGVIYQQADDEPQLERDGNATRERGRRMTNGRCVIDASFAFEVFERLHTGDYHNHGLYRWQRFRPEVGMPWNARLAARIKVNEAQPMSGTATVTVTRSGPGPAIANPTRTASASSVEELRAAFAGQPPIIIDPPVINPGGNPVAETITATVTWTPDQGDPCKQMVEPVTVRWYRGRRFRIVYPVKTGKSSGTHARTGSGTEARTSGSETKHVVPTEIFWAVDNPMGCCSGGRGYCVIQFVRHMWQLNEDPVKQGRDDFNLDILNSEADRANANPPQHYDPTFTHNPRGSDPQADPVVYPSPDGYGNTAILQMDEPGLPDALYQRFLEHGGTFAWNFVSLLVCVIDSGTEDSYLASGLVEQELQWTLQLVFPGGGVEPTVVPDKRDGFPKQHRRCKALSDVLDRLELTQGYSQPRRHNIAIPGN